MKYTYLLAIAQLAIAIDISQLGSLNGPHARVVPTKRGIAADIDVPESNTVPIEDTTSKLASAIKVPSTAAGATAGSTVKSTYANGSPETKKSTGGAAVTTEEDDTDGSGSKAGGNPFLMAISMIVVSEIGDKTFLISALMAMRHSRFLVFSASFASLAIMTILSGIVGHTLPTLLSQRVTQFLAAGLFVVFGFKLTQEGLAMSSSMGVDEELAEVEEELTVSDMNYEMNDVESGRASALKTGPTSFMAQTVDTVLSLLTQLKQVTSQLISPLWVQVFVMIFLGEWGDRSQIATIAMAAGSNYWAVILGAVIGHGLCTAAAVVGGKMLASRISMRTVTLGGAFAFFVFAIMYFVAAWNYEPEQ
ncbi:GCR1-dependent translation factor 1 [Cyberlindnera fabianii]|uniref:GDT1 family protein n=1 Tax=Cyberlindnera fabianii TaxID=36022 RepID=A0A1V2L5Z9_CYBFA|nr:GCR1-dependent translation factor 1 [Cyberlindnera fabianii]